MALVHPTESWSAPIVLAAPTIFQVHSGTVLLDLENNAAAGSEDGFVLLQDPVRPLRDSVVIPSGVTLRYRKPNARPATLYYAPLA